MQREIYLYQSIWADSAKAVMQEMQAAFDAGEEILLRINSLGGSTFAGWGIVIKFRELITAGAKINVVVDGAAMSMAVTPLLYAKKGTRKASDKSIILLHRADMYVSSDEDQAFLDKVNADFRKAYEAIIDAEAFQKITGYTLDDMFDPTRRINITVSAKDAKKIGLIDSVEKLSQEEAQAHENKYMSLAASVYFNIAASASQQPPTPQQQKVVMTTEILRAQHPEVYNSILAQGATAERNRVSAWMQFSQDAPEEVTAGIESGKEITMAEISKFARMAAVKTSEPSAEEKGKTTEKVKADNPPAFRPEALLEKEKNEVLAFTDEVAENLGIKNPFKK